MQRIPGISKTIFVCAAPSSPFLKYDKTAIVQLWAKSLIKYKGKGEKLNVQFLNLFIQNSNSFVQIQHLVQSFKQFST